MSEFPGDAHHDKPCTVEDVLYKCFHDCMYKYPFGIEPIIFKYADELRSMGVGDEINGETSDGYHTFNELYHHRAVLFSVVVAANSSRAWKSKLHHDGTMYDGMFIVGIDTPQGQATYHYDVEPYWGLFWCRELERAPEWDGHTPDDAIERIGSLRDVVFNPPKGKPLSDELGWDQFPPFIQLEGRHGGYEVYTPERTCNLIEDGDRLRCSNCGGAAEKQSWAYWSYCPNCRAKVGRTNELP